MNWLEFVSSLAESLAWPATVVVLVLLLRSPVSRLLLAVTRLKYKELELDFGSELRELKESAGESITVESAPQQSLPSPAEDAKSHLLEATRLASDFPEPAVAVGWRSVEDALFNAVDRLGLAPSEKPNFPPTRNIELLAKSGYLDLQTVDVLRRMRTLRNIAVHGGHGKSSVSVEEANEFIAFAAGVVNKLDELNTDTERKEAQRQRALEDPSQGL
ncbi:MAG: hypothetical protein AAF546_09370 [Verrucomicrobiota bacterium]